LEIEGAAFFLGEPEKNGWDSPQEIGTTTCRVELFCDDPDTVIKRALAAGAAGNLENIRSHKMPRGPHRQGGFVDPFGHIWFVGNKSPLKPFPA
jgi:uncharacterized glyoxalase superfamily protein PhnB